MFACGSTYIYIDFTVIVKDGILRDTPLNKLLAALDLLFSTIHSSFNV